MGTFIFPPRLLLLLLSVSRSLCLDDIHNDSRFKDDLDDGEDYKTSSKHLSGDLKNRRGRGIGSDPEMLRNQNDKSQTSTRNSSTAKSKSSAIGNITKSNSVLASDTQFYTPTMRNEESMKNHYQEASTPEDGPFLDEYEDFNFLSHDDESFAKDTLEFFNHQGEDRQRQSRGHKYENDYSFHFYPASNDTTSRRLSKNSATIGDFLPLDCNSELQNAPCTNDVVLPSGSDPLVIPCGECFVFNLADTSYNIPGGIHIKGKLKFPENKVVTVNTAYIIVQGELEIRTTHSTISEDNKSVVFNFIGTDDVISALNDSPNQDVCAQQPNGKCNLGSKAFVIAGGQLNIEAFPDDSSCSTHTPILKKIYENHSKDPNDFPKFEALPSTCSISGLEYISYDFNDGNVDDWSAGPYKSANANIAANEGALKVTSRTHATNDGPAVDIASFVPNLCLVPGKTYIFTAKIKLDKSDGSMTGDKTGCETSGSYCPRLSLRTRSEDHSIHNFRWLVFMRQSVAPRYGEWGDFTGAFSLNDNELWANTTDSIFQISHVEVGTDITVDNFRLTLPPANMFPDPNDPCGELVMNGDAESIGTSSYPMQQLRGESSLKVVKDEGSANSYFQLTKRSDEWSSILAYVDLKCLDKGVTYWMSAKVRVHSDVKHSYGFFIRALDSNGSWYKHGILDCPAQMFSDGWVTCDGEILIDTRMSTSTDVHWRMVFDDDNVVADVDFDDISIKYHRGFVSKLVVSKSDTQCWDQQSDVHIGSSLLYSFHSSVVENGADSRIIGVLDNGDNTRTIELDSDHAPTVPIISSEENPDFAADIALLTRNVIIQGDSDEDNKGAYLQVLHTPNVQQKISGVQFKNMGSQSEDDRFGLQILYSGSLPGTEISKNSFYRSNHRCIVLEGTKNVTVLNNVGVSNAGHCIYSGPRARDNVISNNFVSDTRDIAHDKRIEGSSDHDSAAFFTWNGPNSYNGNIAVGNRKYGFRFYNDYRSRLEDLTFDNSYDPRTVAVGPFSYNQAKSNGHSGFHFSGLRQEERVVVSGLISLKNRYSGFYFYGGQRYTISDSIFAENRIGIETRWADDCIIQDTKIVGLTSETKALVAQPFYGKPCVGLFDQVRIGYLMPTAIWRFDIANFGAKLSNVIFSDFDDEDECQGSMPMKFSTDEIRDGHWNYVSSFNNVQIDGSKILPAAAAAQLGLKDIVITDIGGSLDPSGQVSTTSSIVSNRPELTTLARGSCEEDWEGMTYCRDTCFRSVTIKIDQDDTADLVMKVTRVDDSIFTQADQFYLYDDDDHLRGYEASSRKFSVPLPHGNYKIEFLDSMQEIVWPKFAYEVWEGKPECDSNSYANGPDVTIFEPALDQDMVCNNLIRNSDFSMGTSFWKHMNDRSETSRGYLSELPGKGLSGSKAIGYFNRLSHYRGIGQNLDSRCFRQNADAFFEIKVWFRREDAAGVLQLCDRFNDQMTVRCPEVRIKYVRYQDESKEDLKWDYPRNGKTVMTNNSREFDLFHGIMRINNGLEQAQRVLIFMDHVHKDLSLILHKFTVNRLELICTGNLIQNGSFDSGYSSFWRNYGTLKWGIVDVTGNNAIELIDKDEYRHGIYQSIYWDKSCFFAGNRLQVTAKVRLQNAQGSDIPCDLNTANCGYIRIGTHRHLVVARPTAVATDAQSNGWGILAGIYKMDEGDINYSNPTIRLTDTPISDTVVYDDIQMTLIPQTCGQMILNPTFEDGTSAFWYPSDNRVNFSILRNSPGDGDYALLFNYGAAGSYWHHMYQEVDARCFTDGEVLEIHAKMKLVDSINPTTVLSCDPSLKHVWEENSCPTVHLYAQNCDGDDVQRDLWNKSQDPWTPSAFNSFQYDFTVDANLASCKDVKIGIGKWTHTGRSVLVSEVKVGERTTKAPTKAPTFKPTELKTKYPTAEPSSRPSTVHQTYCPPLGSSHVVVDESSTILARTGSNALCTLTKVTLEDGNVVKTMPLARSYNQHDWEVSAGKLAASVFPNGINCYSSACQVDLPPSQPNEEYRLKSFSKSLSTRDTFARFLETATFGILSEDLDGLAQGNGQGSAIANWIRTQMNLLSTPMTSHRAYWREKANPRAPIATRVGIPDHPCEKHSRWRRFTFVKNDAYRLWPKELRVEGTGPYVLYLDGAKRTIVEDFWLDKDAGFQFDPNAKYILGCHRIYEEVGGGVSIRLTDGRCVYAENPAVNLTSIEGSSLILDISLDDLAPIDEYYTKGEEFILQKPLTNSLCNSIPDVFEHGDEMVFARLSDGTWLQFDPRIQLETNTLNSPLSDGGKSIQLKSGGQTHCSNAPRTFLNEESCQHSSNACQSISSSDELEILLDDKTISELNTLTGRYVYRIEGLNVVDQDNPSIKLEHPCSPNLRSRWVPKDSNDGACNPTQLGSSTNETLYVLLSQGGSGENAHLKDIYFPESGSSCDGADTNPEIEIVVGGVCWQRVHEEFMSVYDMTYWVDNHPGGPDKITKWSDNNGTVLVFPNEYTKSPHPMQRWDTFSPKFTFIGRFGDYLRIRDLPNEFRTEAVTSYYDSDAGSSISFICGSPGEVSNDPVHGLTFDLVNNDFTSGQYSVASNRQNLWYMIAIGASDQLRQRVAWSLAQILVVVTDAIGDARLNSEWFFAYYDIFVRNAFGNYRDILREISYSPLMAENLSFLQSRSSGYLWERYGVKAQADENFAREIMQLFSMGVNKLNMDGSLKLDAQGNSQLAYTNDDIMSFSRAWTGFDLQPFRSNMEGESNRLDPMRIEAQWRDRFPKTDTDGGYIGDNYPLCADLPEKTFLKKGASYRFLGSSSLPELQSDHSSFASDETIKRMVLSTSSQLFQKLCNQSNGSCQFENSVVLETSLPCSGNECNVDTVRVLQVGESFYEYVGVPCVYQAFYEGGVKISPQYRWDAVMCANPKLSDASEACCEQLDQYWATRNYSFDGERMRRDTARNKCAAVNRDICDFSRVVGDRHKTSIYYWTSDDCQIKVKVNVEGMVTIVHQPSDSTKLVSHVDESNENYFRVYWKENEFPIASTECGECELMSDGSCLCETVVAERQVFNRAPRSKDEILEKLFIGAPDPDSFEPNKYTMTYDSGTGVKTYVSNGNYGLDTIFSFVNDKGRQFRLKNSAETVILKGGDYKFRNAPHFMNFVPTEATKRDAQYETEATLDHYFYHDNTAPFLAMRLIQRLTLSNPTPRYIYTVASAFKEGQYLDESGLSFGAGTYGDMAAMFAAIYLDREARSTILDADSSHGSLREPILKLVTVLRSMQFKSSHPVTYLRHVKRFIGQIPHAFETVFSFFLPEYEPYGRVGDASLVSPEATLLDMPKIVGTINLFRSLVKYGLSSCSGGVGWHHCREKEYVTSPLGKLEYGIQDQDDEISQETFEGPSLKGGFDNQWVGRNYYSYHGAVVSDPLNEDNHVYNPKYDHYHARIYSAPHKVKGSSLVVKFKYYASQNQAGGCIGYSQDERLVAPSWIICDAPSWYAQAVMTPETDSYISCQFEIPNDVDEFRIVLGDRLVDGYAYFDDIEVTPGTGTTCGVNASTLTPPGTDSFAIELVDELATILTAGRLSQQHRALIVNAYNNAGSANDGLKIAQQLILSSSEFHTTNNFEATDEIREDISFPDPGNLPYRAVVYIMLAGGADSYNMLAPHTCSGGGKDLYQEYLEVRQQVGLSRQSMLPIGADDQICETFGIHPDLPFVKDLYQDNDLAFFANTGVLSRPVDKTNWNSLTKTQLFAHNHMQRESKRIDPYGANTGTGVLGRMGDVLSKFGYNVGSFSVDRFSVALVGQPGVTAAPMIVNRDGVPPVYVEEKTKKMMKELHNSSTFDSGHFAEMWSSAFTDSLNINDVLSSELDGIKVQTEFPSSYLSLQLKTVAKLIATRNARGVNVDTFYVEIGGFDTHANVEENLSNRFKELNEGIGAFSEELKKMGLWNNVVTIQTSDFARTLHPNSGDGTDHAWGGNYMMFGGAVKGGKILGKYPDSLAEGGELVLGRGRVIPSTPWDAVFKGIAKWAGVPENRLSSVCPNIINFGSSLLFEDNDMFYFGPGSPCSTNQDCDDNNDEGTNDVCVLGKCQNNLIEGVCGNGKCEPQFGETCSTCVKDCVAPFFCNKLGSDRDFDGVSAAPDIKGIEFSMKAKNDIAVSKIDINVNDDGETGAKVFVKQSTGNRRRLEVDLADYTKIYDNDAAQAEGGIVSLEFDNTVVMDAGEEFSFFVHLSEGSRLMLENDVSEDEAVAENNDLQVFGGQAVNNDINDTGDSGVKALSGTFIYDYTDENLTAPPSPSPHDYTEEVEEPKKGGGGGDPHFYTFNGKSFSFHGECDLVMLQSLNFSSGLGLHVHIRTTRVDHPMQSFSYVSGVAIKLGTDVIEIMDNDAILLNGDNMLDEFTFAGFPVRKATRGKNKNIHVYDFDLDEIGSTSIEVRANGRTGMLFVDVSGNFDDGVGLLGSGKEETSAKLLGRDRITDFTDEWNSFGEEWQVRDTEPKLFLDDRMPQYPTGCVYDASAHTTHNLRSRHRRLTEVNSNEVVTREMAMEACSEASGKKKEFCIGDVMVSGDVELAEDPFYN